MTSRLAQMQARFQQKQIQEREEKLLRLHESQQQKAFERVGRGSAGSNTSTTSVNSIGAGNTAAGGGKVRQMFEERRQKAGIDRSYPLQPLKVPNRSGGVNKTNNNNNGTATTTTISSSSTSTIKTFNNTTMKNGNKTIQKKSTSKVYNNNNNINNNNNTNGGEYNKFIETFNGLEDNTAILLKDCYLDDKALPQSGGNGEPDASIFRKLPNVGGKLPSQRGVVAPKKPSDTTLGKTFRKETKPIVKKSTSKPAEAAPLKTTRTNSETKNSQMASTRSTHSNRPSSKQGPPKPTATAGDLTECKYCNRTFATDRIQKHEEICGKASRRKRKLYDATKHRIEGTELEQFVKGKPKAKVSLPPSKTATKKDWRKTHEEFILAIRAAKQAQAHVAAGGKLSDLPPPPPSSNPDYVQCPHCSRRFNEAAAARHIPKCATYLHNKPKPALSKSSKSGSTPANRFR